MKSAIRRHHYYRLQRKRKWYWGGPGDAPQNWGITFLISEKERLGKLANTPHPCSRFCCANRRRFEGPSINEIRKAPRIEDWEDQ